MKSVAVGEKNYHTTKILTPFEGYLLIGQIPIYTSKGSTPDTGLRLPWFQNLPLWSNCVFRQIGKHGKGLNLDPRPGCQNDRKTPLSVSLNNCEISFFFYLFGNEPSGGLKRFKGQHGGLLLFGEFILRSPDNLHLWKDRWAGGGAKNFCIGS